MRCAAGQPRGRLGAAAPGAHRGRPGRGRGHPAAAPAGPGPRHRHTRQDRLVLRGQRGAAYPELVEAMRDGQRVALVTDGGMPSVSDPGYRLVAAVLAAGLPVTCAPGPSAVTTALALSGLPCDRFCFEGFLPRKGGERRARLAALAAEERTLVFFESTHRVQDTLADLVAAFGGDRAAALCRELTKTYEEVRRAPLAELAELDEFRGEITLVVAGAVPDTTRPTDEQLIAEVAAHVAEGMSRRDAAAAVAAAHRLPKRDVYDLSTRR
ncbi:16S rRNA (cytidine(1402)-2'-O)-methyltransferase [Catellatospora coxensis]